MKALWVLQQNLINDEDADGMIKAVSDIGDTAHPIHVVPFSYEIPDISYKNGPIIPYGGTNWINSIYLKKMWTLFFNENFRYSVALKHYGKHMFNSDAVFMKMKDFSPSLFEDEQLFIRPDKDLKEFAGHVVYKNTFMKWLKEIQGKGYLVNEETEILVSKASRVDCEWRIFVVDGKPISGSQYRIDYYCKTNPNVPKEVFDFVENMVKIWTPSPVFVMDICKVNDELSILEIGDFHSAGWYESDKVKVMQAVSDYAKGIYAKEKRDILQ